MSAIRISGGIPLSGMSRVHGSKNSALPILTASILAKDRCFIRNCPDLLDITLTQKILRNLGSFAERCGDGIIVNSSKLNSFEIPDELMRGMRSSVIFLGPLLALTGEAVLSLPGGCPIGKRPIDIHLTALKKMGAEITEDGSRLHCKTRGLVGSDISLPFPSVGATENIMLAAATADGITRIIGAAKEPEIVDLQNFLNAMGAEITGGGSSIIKITGVSKLHGAEYRVMPDRIVAATLLSAVSAAGGEITLTDTNPEDLKPVLKALEVGGLNLSVQGEAITARREGRKMCMKQIVTMPHPGFPTDAQALLMAVAAASEGVTVFRETIFESRYGHVAELCKMGADISVHERIAVVFGVEKLRGASLRATDLRGGAALAIAALAAEGESEISCIGHIDRGYENLEGMLRSLGANAARVMPIAS